MIRAAHDLVQKPSLVYLQSTQALLTLSSCGLAAQVLAPSDNGIYVWFLLIFLAILIDEWVLAMAEPVEDGLDDHIAEINLEFLTFAIFRT